MLLIQWEITNYEDSETGFVLDPKLKAGKRSPQQVEKDVKET